MDKNSLFFRLLRIGLGTEGMDNVSSVLSTTPASSLKMTNPAQDDKMEASNVILSAVEKSDTSPLSIIHYLLSIKQGVGAFIFDGLQKATETGVLPNDAVSREVKMKLFSHTMQVEQLCKAQYAKAAELAGIYAEHGIRTVVLKGIAAGQCYPNPWHRPCGDLDCYLLDDYERGNEIARRSGASVDDHSYKHSHIEFKGLMVENHQFCTPISGCRRTKRFERLLHEILAAEGATKIGETQLENPSPLFNALFLTFHGRSHFLIDGIALRHLCDWAMLLHKCGSEIDWERFCRLADEYGLRVFADAMTRLSAQYLGVKVPENYVPCEDEAREAYLMKEMLQGLPEHKSGTSLWRQRLRIIGRMRKHRKRYRMFSDESFEKRTLKLAYALMFDRYPKL